MERVEAMSSLVRRRKNIVSVGGPEKKDGNEVRDTAHRFPLYVQPYLSLDEKSLASILFLSF